MDSWNAASATHADSLGPRIRTRAGTALVLGAGGKLGRALSRQALPRFFFRVVGLDHGACDITRPERIAAALDTHRPRVVFNAAAFNDVDAAERQHGLAFRVNALGPRYLAQACRRRRVRLVHFSSDFVFPGGPTPFAEAAPAAPLSRYGASKAEGEQAVREESGREHLIVRVAGLVAERGPCFPRTVLRAALAGQPLRVVNDRFGTQTWVRDLAHVVALLVVRGVDGVVHVAPPDLAPWDEIAAEILTLAGLRGEIVPVPGAALGSAARRPERAQLALGRLTELGIQGPPPWRQGLQRFFGRHRATLLDSVARQLAAEAPDEAPRG